MSNILLEYMKSRFNDKSEGSVVTATKPGPVITISRDFGCTAKKLAAKLVEELDRLEAANSTGHRWKWIGKEILDQSAKELKLEYNMVRDIATKGNSNVVDDIILSLSHKYYPGDRKIKKTIGRIIKDFSTEGHVIIVGRGGVSITRDIRDSLHIKLQAPLEWRVNNVSKIHMITLSESRKRIQQIDSQRQIIREYFEGKKIENSVYDVIFNYETLDEDEIASTIIHMLKYKDIV